jgi:hypothetical protein
LDKVGLFSLEIVENFIELSAVVPLSLRNRKFLVLSFKNCIRKGKLILKTLKKIVPSDLGLSKVSGDYLIKHVGTFVHVLLNQNGDFLD